MRRRGIVLLMAGLGSLACGGGDTPNGGPTPGTFDVELAGSASASMVVLRISGPDAPTAVDVLAGYQVAWSFTSGGGVQAVVYGGDAVVIGKLATVHVPDKSHIGQFQVTVEEIASSVPPYAQLAPGALTPIQPQ